MADLQRQAGNAAVAHLLSGPDPTSDVQQAVRGGGQPLPPGVRSDLEAALGADFSDVRVHTDPQAAASAEAVRARAYTVGNHVVFAPGAYTPETSGGRHTLAHELAHVVQQRHGPVSGSPVGQGLSVSDPSDAFERAAEATAAAVAASPPVARGPAAAGPEGASRAAAAQRQVPEEEEEPLQRQAVASAEEEEEELPPRRAAEDQDEEEDEDRP